MTKLTDLELAKTAVVEEAAEVTIEICKIERFGIDSVNPYGDGMSNRVNLAKEVGDLLGAIDFLREQIVLDDAVIEGYRAKKPGQLRHFNDMVKDAQSSNHVTIEVQQDTLVPVDRVWLNKDVRYPAFLVDGTYYPPRGA